MVGAHGGPGAADAALLDTSRNFTGSGVVPGLRMVLYNLTAGTNGYVTAATQTTLTATGVTWDLADEYRIMALDGDKIAAIEERLDIMASNVHAELHAIGACDCTLAVWALEFFKKLNILEAGAFERCPCNRTVTRADGIELLAFMQTRLELIRTGDTEPCAGHTGANWPAAGWAEQTLTEFNVAKIIVNTAERES